MFKHCFICKKIIWLGQRYITTHDLPKWIDFNKITYENIKNVEKYRTNERFSHIKCHDKVYGYRVDDLFKS
jgi:hypothetical protein